MRNINKFRAIPSECDGFRFASKKEMKRYQDLRLLERGKAIRNLRLQPRFDLSFGNVHVCDYVADFEYFDNERGVVVEDVKGCKTGAAYQLFKLKKKLMKAIYQIEVEEI